MKVTVLMSVYNGEKYLREAIESILNQTFKDFEFLIINDASSDKSREIILSYDDPRIRLVDNGKNLGLTKSLNVGLKLAEGEYIARMDADDISLPERLEKQVAFLDKNRSIGICGSWLKVIGDRSAKEWKMPEESAPIKASMLFFNPLFHSTIVLRKNIFQNYNLNYDEEFRSAQDYELWSRAKNFMEMLNLQEPLVIYRRHTNQITTTNGETQKRNASKIQENLLHELGIEFTQEEISLHRSLACNQIEKSKTFIDSSDAWLDRLRTANGIKKLYSEKAFDSLLLEKRFFVYKSCANLGFWTWNNFVDSKLFLKVSLKEKLKFFLRYMISYLYNSRRKY